MTLSPAEAKRQKKALWRDIARAERDRMREHLAELGRAIRDARALRKSALVQARERCRAERLAARGRARAERARLLAELHQVHARERARAREACQAAYAEARALSDKIARTRAELRAEKAYRAEMRRVERLHRERQREHRKRYSARGVRRGESDDEVRGNIPPELAALFERVKQRIRGSDRKSRTEAFLQYAEEHPNEVLEVLEDKTDALVRELEARERSARRAMRSTRPAARPRAAAAAGGVPF
jgi:hypothetical protein